MAENGLDRLRVESLGGIVFGTFSDATPSLEAYIGERLMTNYRRMTSRPFKVLGYYSQYLDSNWKLYFENSSDPYHATILHAWATRLKLNRFTHRGREYPFNLEDAHEAMRRLKPTPDRLKGLRGTNQDVYDTLVLGTTITKTIDGDSKSYSFRYVDWENPDNNTYHVTAEMTVERAGSTRIRRCDIVAFVNGIPFIVIENKRPTERLKKADSQLIGYQREDEIPHLFHFAQILLSMNRREARYATVGTQSRFWQTWREEEITVEGTFVTPQDESEDTETQASEIEFEPEEQAVYPTADPLRDLVDRPLAVAEEEAIYSGNLASARSHYEAAIAGEGRQVTAQDVALYALCRRERLLDLVRRFTVFDGGVWKIARHQQYFAVRRAVERVRQFDLQDVRRGGVIWHTPGTGKSLTMVMLGKALALEETILNPRIIIVTDREDLDRQIKDTFKSCEMEPVRATSGTHLISLIRNRTPLVTTIINKFDTASRIGQAIDEDPNASLARPATLVSRERLFCNEKRTP